MPAGGGQPYRPFGVTLIAFLTLAAVLWTLAELAPMLGGQSRATLPPAQRSGLERQAHAAAVWAGVGLLAAAGLFAVRRWGWWLALAYYAGTVVLVVLEWPYLDHSTEGLSRVIFKTGFALLVIWYLTSRDLRAVFRRR
jgi:hypothetical protein